jgi:hypothetical protein
MTLGSTQHLVGPRLVWAGVVYLTASSPTTTVKIPRLLPYNEQLVNYVVLAQPMISGAGQGTGVTNQSQNWADAAAPGAVTPVNVTTQANTYAALGNISTGTANYYYPMAVTGQSDTTDPAAYAPYDVSVLLTHASFAAGGTSLGMPVVLQIYHV